MMTLAIIMILDDAKIIEFQKMEIYPSSICILPRQAVPARRSASRMGFASKLAARIFSFKPTAYWLDISILYVVLSVLKHVVNAILSCLLD